jgi:hypothetical protein
MFVTRSMTVTVLSLANQGGAMSGTRKMPAIGWLVVGFAVALLAFPTAAGANAALKFGGIEGTSGNQADVTGAGQLLTTRAKPSKYEDYEGEIFSANGLNDGSQCVAVGPSAIPAGKVFVAQQIQVAISAENSSTPYSGPHSGTGAAGNILIGVKSPRAYCAQSGLPVVTDVVPPNGNIGNVSVPLTPSYVIPSGDTINALGSGMNARIFVTGYLVPSADAPTVPQ